MGYPHATQQGEEPWKGQHVGSVTVIESTAPRRLRNKTAADRLGWICDGPLCDGGRSPRGNALLPRHGDPQAVFGRNEMIETHRILAEIDLHPVDLTVELVAPCSIVGA